MVIACEGERERGGILIQWTKADVDPDLKKEGGAHYISYNNIWKNVHKGIIYNLASLWQP